MKTSDTRAYVNQLIVGLLVTLGFGGTVGVGTVWMRHQVSVVADANATLLRQIGEAERRIADTTALVEEAMSSDVLRAKNEAMRLGLVAMTQGQINQVYDDHVRRLVARANQRAFQREVSASAIGIQFHVDPAATAPLPEGRATAAAVNAPQSERSGAAVTVVPTRFTFASSN